MLEKLEKMSRDNPWTVKITDTLNQYFAFGDQPVGEKNGISTSQCIEAKV